MMGSNASTLLLVILLPAVFAALALIIPSRYKAALQAVLLIGFAANLVLSLSLFGKEMSLDTPWGGFDINFSLKLYQFSGFILLGAAVLSFLVAVYTAVFLKETNYAGKFYACQLFTILLTNGAVLANNLVVMLFFWESILVTMFFMIMLGGKQSFKTSVKAVIIGGVADLCLMLGIGMTGYLAKTMTMDAIHLPLTSWGIFGFVFMTIGAVAKAGAMPFHTWIPDAADDAPTPFLAFLPGTLEKLLGIYLLARICLDLYKFEHGSLMSTLMMTLGVVTILSAVMMALIQKDFKRLLSYHAVSQVGYMILGIGTGLPIGIVGGLFHMLNHAFYKCCLFLTAGSVERQTGTTDLKKISGLGRKMPVTFACFIVAALSIAGFPLTNGFYSKELVFDGALESGLIFYIVALAGAFFTAISFLKLGHAAFLGKPGEKTQNVKEAPWPMLVAMIALAVGCLSLGFGKSWAIEHFFQPILGAASEGEHIGAETNWMLVGISVGVLALSVLDHLYGYKKTGKGLEAADHIHYLPGLHTVYNMAEKKYFDPYEVGRYVIRGFAGAALAVNNGISYFYDVLVVKAVDWLSGLVKKAHSGSQSRYLQWVLVGAALVTVLLLVVM